MQVLDLFSGIGGFSIGLEKVGFETVAFCEIEPYCQAVLRKHWPDTPIYNDVRELTAERLRTDGLVPNVIVGGYPCQPFSLAGGRQGEEDDRHLWPEVLRLIKEIRPTWGIFENVAGHISMGLDEVLSDLEAEDYAARPFVIPACGVDAPHRRDRVWIVARDVADTSSQRLQGRAEEQAHRFGDLQGQSERSGENRADFWAVEPNVGRVANGVSNRSHRIKALGNAVVPQIPEQIGRIIKQLEGAL